MWVRGLKHGTASDNVTGTLSHPMWVRGLKLPLITLLLLLELVAPYVGAWIETSSVCSPLHEHKSHPMWVRGLKPNDLGTGEEPLRRTLCGCVD